uniref:Calmodulin n=1 Tax=Macrostomum lignano TaxID=282301 RepID=A0A1I8F6Y1_9PLAT
RLSMAEFRKGVADFGLDLTDEEVKAAFNQVDTDQSGSIDFSEFLASRLKLIKAAFQKMDKTGDGQITVKDLKGIYNARQHPKYQNGEWSRTRYSPSSSRHSKLQTRPMECNSIDHDDSYFDLMMRNSWKLFASNSTNLARTRVPSWPQLAPALPLLGKLIVICFLPAENSGLTGTRLAGARSSQQPTFPAGLRTARILEAKSGQLRSGFVCLAELGSCCLWIRKTCFPKRSPRMSTGAAGGKVEGDFSRSNAEAQLPPSPSGLQDGGDNAERRPPAFSGLFAIPTKKEVV